jgi:hypothetical protein
MKTFIALLTALVILTGAVFANTGESISIGNWDKDIVAAAKTLGPCDVKELAVADFEKLSQVVSGDVNQVPAEYLKYAEEHFPMDALSPRVKYACCVACAAMITFAYLYL